MCTITHAIETRPYFNRRGLEARKISALVFDSCHVQIQSVPGRIFQPRSIKKNRPGTEASASHDTCSSTIDSTSSSIIKEEQRLHGDK